MRILFIAPHLSTGGLPQYLLKKIKSLKYDNEIHCVEYNNCTGGVLIVQREQVEKICKPYFYSLNENKYELLNLIKSIKPDIIHFEEMPEYFMDMGLAFQIYNKSRDYKIIETSHDSSFDVTTKRVYPDKFILVSEFQKLNLKSLNIESEVIEYPVSLKLRKNRESGLKFLGLDVNKKHVFHVGLFTPRKNQKEFIEYARALENENIQFHCIGNMADNFKFYWEPLIKSLPSNVKVWGERKDVENFYSCMDLFLFTSRGHQTDKETAPIVIKEAISYNVPSLIYNLPVYLNGYKQYSNVEYLDFESKNNNCKKILELLNKEKPEYNNIVNLNFISDEIEMWSNWNADEQKMHFGAKTDIGFPILIVLKEYMSDGIFWSSKYNELKKDWSYWIIPFPKEYRNLKNDLYVSGIKMCVYNCNNGEQIYEFPYFNKFYNKTNLRLSNSIPYYLNYEEFFVIKKYKKFFKRKFKNVVDAGANVGVFISYILQEQLTDKVLAVECDPQALKDLNKNFKKESKVKIINKALNTNDEKICFFHNPENPVISTTIRNENFKKIEVESVTINNLINELETIDFLKVDIEGFEYEIFEKLDDEKFNKINNIFIECHFFENDSKNKFDLLVNKIKKNGFSVYDPFELTTNFNHSGKSEVILFEKI